MPTILRNYGIRSRFYGSDKQEPPHNLVLAQGDRAKAWLDPMAPAENQGFKSSDLKRILEVARKHRNELLEAWDEFFKSISGGTRPRPVVHFPMELMLGGVHWRNVHEDLSIRGMMRGWKYPNAAKPQVATE